MTQARTRQIRRTQGGSAARPPPKQASPEKSRSMSVRRAYRSGPNGFTAAGDFEHLDGPAAVRRDVVVPEPVPGLARGQSSWWP